MDPSVETELDRIASLQKDKDAAALLDKALALPGALGVRALHALKAAGKDGAKRLTRVLESEETAERVRAVRALGEIGGKGIGKTLGGLLSDEAPDVRAQRGGRLGRLGEASQAKAVVGLLSDEAPHVRRAAARALAELGKPADALADLLADDVPIVRRTAVLALAATDPAPHVEALLGLVDDEDEGVRSAALAALAGLSGEELVDRVRAALDDDSEGVRLAAARTLAATEGVEDLLPQLLENRSIYVRRVGIEAVVRRQVPGAVEPLMRVARDGPERVVRIEAARALGALGDSKAVGRLTQALIEDDFELQEAAEQALRSILGKDADPDVLRANGHIALERWDRLPELGRPALEPLLRALGNRTPNPRNVAARCGAARALGTLGLREAVKPLLEALLEPAPQLRTAAAAALGGVGDPAAAAGLVTAASDSSDEVREAAVLALGRLGTDDVVATLTEAVGDPRPAVRHAALEAARHIGVGAVSVAAAALVSAEPSDRQRAIDVLEQARSVEAVDLLHEALLDHDGPTRERARGVLERIGWHPLGMRLRRTDAGFSRWYLCSEWVAEGAEELPDQVELLLGALDDADASRRRAAIETLGELGDERAVEPLQGLLSSDAPDIQACAGNALVALGVGPGDGPEWIPWRVASHDWPAVVEAGEAALPALTSEGAHPDARVKAAVVRAGAEIARPGSVALIVQAFRSPADEVHAASVAALAALPEDVLEEGTAALPDDVVARVLPPLAETAVGGGPLGERQVAVRVLALRPEAEAMAALRAVVEADEAELHARALAALATRGQTGAAGIVEERARYSPDTAVRVEGARALVELVGEGAVPALTALLLEDREVLQAEADRLLSGVLGKRYDRRALEAGRLADLGSWEALAGYGAQAIEALRGVLSDPLQNQEASERRAAAVGLLGRVAGEDALDDLVAAAGTDTSSLVRASACEALGALGVPGGGDAVLGCLADHFPEARQAAATAVPALSLPEAPQALAPLLQDEDEAVRGAAAASLVSLGRQSVEVLVDALAGAGSGAERFSAVVALGEIADPRACDALVDQLGDAELPVRKAAQQALVACGWLPVGLRVRRTDPGFARWTTRSEWTEPDDATPQVEVLQAALSDPDPVRRRIAVETLGDIGDPAAVPALKQALEGDDDVDVRIVAAQSLVTLGEAAEPTPAWAPFWAGAGQWSRCVALGEPAVAPLASMLDEHLPRVLLGAVLALAAIGTEEARAAVVGMRADPDGRVAGAARDAVGEEDGEAEQGGASP